MREILFRGKRLDRNKWVEGAFCPKNCDDPFEPMVDRPSIIKLDNPCDGFWFDVDPATVGQYTGLRDKNGKKIFEGDRVRYPDNIGYVEYDEDWNEGVVDWDDEEMLFYFTNRWSVAMGDFDVVDGKMMDVEVIGNIHDNPELLGGDES